MTRKEVTFYLIAFSIILFIYACSERVDAAQSGPHVDVYDAAGYTLEFLQDDYTSCHPPQIEAGTKVDLVEYRVTWNSNGIIREEAIFVCPETRSSIVLDYNKQAIIKKENE